MPKFFIPFVEAEKQEDAYKEISEYIGALPRVVGNRAYSITWKHNNVVWTATVGETLRGVEIITTGRGKDRREREISRQSSDTVLAIFPGIPGLIAHDNKSKIWNMPILTGEGWNIVMFD